MKQTKCVWQFHDKRDTLKEVFDYFRFCTNEMIRISEQKNLTSRGAMHNEFYKNLRGDFIAKYIQSAHLCSKSKIETKPYNKKEKT